MDNISVQDTPFPLLIIKGTYTEEETDKILKEMKFISSDNKMEGIYTNQAKNEEGGDLKSNTGVWVEEIYTGANISDILRFNIKLLDVLDDIKSEETGWFWDNYEVARYFTLLSYYENGSYYETHKDLAGITAVTYFFDTPKKFKGGNLEFPSYDIKVPVENNMTVVFPSCIPHMVQETSLINNKDMGKQKGRYAMLQFCHPG
jgi:Rps23 Pro-64 3,4-dihydroxylase Tpa1-like proline 4-hydroxylase